MNPCYVPRNQVMQEAIREAEAGNFEEVSARCVKAPASSRQPSIRFGNCVSVSGLLLCAVQSGHARDHQGSRSRQL